MLKRFIYTYERFHGFLEDKFEREVYAENIRDAELLVFAMLKDFYAESQSEAMATAEVMLNQELGAGRTTRDFIGLDICSEDGMTAYRFHDIWEWSQD